MLKIRIICWLCHFNSFNVMQVAQHDAPIKTCHWVQAPNYQCLMTGSWDKSLRFWDLRKPTPVLSLDLKERCYSADVVYPMAVVTTAQKGSIFYHFEFFFLNFLLFIFYIIYYIYTLYI